MTMETTTVVPSLFVLRWRLVVAVRCKDPRKLRRRHVKHRWSRGDDWILEGMMQYFQLSRMLMHLFFFPCFVDN